jgi:hypothetical protein
MWLYYASLFAKGGGEREREREKVQKYKTSISIGMSISTSTSSIIASAVSAKLLKSRSLWV